MRFVLLFLPFFLIACDNPNEQNASVDAPLTAATAEECDEDNGGIELPDGFCARIFAEVGSARHIAIRDNGDVYVKLMRPSNGGIVALRDTTGDFRADVEERFADYGGTGIRIHNGYLYASSDVAVYRYRLDSDALVPTGDPEIIVEGFPPQNQHASKTIELRGNDLFVNMGAPSNNCQQQDRSAGSPGQDPCPLYAGIWRFDANQTGQQFNGNENRYASGIRNTVGMMVNPADGDLYVVQHGRDQLDAFWSEHFTAEQNAELPAEELLRVREGDAFSWPYCYYDPMQQRLVLAPEYGGDGQITDRCEQFPDPVYAFPAHWAPQDVLFYTGSNFPERYQSGVFVAWHGSWNRAPSPQRGFKVTFLPMSNGQAANDFEVFADNFTGTDEPIYGPSDARWRPMALAQTPDGALFIAESRTGRIWRVVYVGG